MTSLLSASTLRAMGQKEYEKRKHAALEVEAIVRDLHAANDDDKVDAIVHQLAKELAASAHTNLRKGALHALSGAAIGMRNDVKRVLSHLLPPVLAAFADQDARVRYTACEALYNIAKIARSACVPHINGIFDGLFKLSADTDPQVQNGMQLLDRLMKDVVTESDAFNMDDFMPLLGERIYVSNPFSRQFLVGWISALDSVPDIDMLAYLPVYFDGLFHMLADTNKEIRQQTYSVLSDLLRDISDAAESIDYSPIVNVLVQHCASQDKFTRLTAITWLQPLIAQGEEAMLPFCPQVLDAVLSSLSHPEEEIREAAARADVALRELMHATSDVTFDVHSLLHALSSHLVSQYVPTLLASLHWVDMLLHKDAPRVMELSQQLWPSMFKCLSNPSEEVVRLDLESLARMVPDTARLEPFCELLLALLRTERMLLERRGALIVRQLCELLQPHRVFVTLARSLTAEEDIEFAAQMVQTLNLIALTSPEAMELRLLLKASVTSDEGSTLFKTLYPAWAHNPVALLSICLIAQAYEHASELVLQFAAMEISLPFLLQIDKLVQLIESPVFTHVRLHLLEPELHPFLLKTMWGILMLLPQSPAFHTLKNRLAAVPDLGIFRLQLEASRGRGAGPKPTSATSASVDFVALLSTYREVQGRHRGRLLQLAQVRRQAQGSTTNAPQPSAAQ